MIFIYLIDFTVFYSRTVYSGEFQEDFMRISVLSYQKITILCRTFKHRQVRCKKKHILPPQAETSSVFICFADYAVTSKCNGASSSAVACELWRDKQARLPEFGEDVPSSFHYAVARKKRLTTFE